MNRRTLGLLAGLLALVATAGRAAEDDSIGADLDRAKAAWQAHVERHREAVGAWFDRREEAARRAGNKRAVDQVKAEREAFEEQGQVPRNLPAAIRSQDTRARTALEAAYKLAVREYTRAGLDDEATAAEQEWEAFVRGGRRPADAIEFGGRYYKVFDTQLTWHEAKKACELVGGRLAVVKSAEENEFLVGLVTRSNVVEAWLGATDEQREGVWLWVTGERMTYANWGPGQPNNKGGVEHYLMLILAHNGRWSDQPARSVQHKPGFVCQWD